MQKTILTILLFTCFNAYSQADIFDSATLRSRINSEIIANGTRAITGTQLNRILNGFLNILPTPSNGVSKTTTYPYHLRLGGILNQNTTISGASLYDINFINAKTLRFAAQNIQLQTKTMFLDTLTHKPFVVDANGNIMRLHSWAGVGGGSGAVVKPFDFKVGTTAGAPGAGATDIVLSGAENLDVQLYINGQYVSSSPDATVHYTKEGGTVTLVGTTLKQGDEVHVEFFKYEKSSIAFGYSILGTEADETIIVTENDEMIQL